MCQEECANTAQSPSHSRPHGSTQAYTCRAFSLLWATPLEKTVHRTVFSALTPRATLVGHNSEGATSRQIYVKIKKKNTQRCSFLYWLRRQDWILRARLLQSLSKASLRASRFSRLKAFVLRSGRLSPPRLRLGKKENLSHATRPCYTPDVDSLPTVQVLPSVKDN